MNSICSNAAFGLVDGIMATDAAIDGMLGVEDVRLRIELVTGAHKHMLPGTDSINPGKVNFFTSIPCYFDKHLQNKFTKPEPQASQFGLDPMDRNA